MAHLHPCFTNERQERQFLGSNRKLSSTANENDQGQRLLIIFQLCLLYCEFNVYEIFRFFLTSYIIWLLTDDGAYDDSIHEKTYYLT